MNKMSNLSAIFIFLAWITFKIAFLVIVAWIAWFLPISNILKIIFTILISVGGIEDLVIMLTVIMQFTKLQKVIKFFDNISLGNR